MRTTPWIRSVQYAVIQNMKTLICIPGLGGHPSVFSEYPGLLPEYELRPVELVDHRKALAEVRTMLVAAKDPAILFCHCYSAQMGIQLAAEMPDKVERLILLEPFFVEQHRWLKTLIPLAILLMGMARFFSWIGVRRRNLNYRPDYVALAKYPIYLQPFFDMRWQNLPDYLDKCYDILAYGLPANVATPTLMIFSPSGFLRDRAKRERLKQIFSRLAITETPDGTHNVIAMAAGSVAAAIRQYLSPKT